ncbi:glycosyltransferase family 2 protein [Ichthyenterobacterium magnum]|uniref:Cellulose synthase/poly-beta-1,6-N-acetylglucosamine synthase-like glycosyltransferase n=1 Tax=Ichthyenterobacterium magnum TaxID=1230530 RepID=A0A420DW59_9FLAO|nr:glycosyltransferase [Ichthyenterobacterium magnum]RKE98464.1 cellulose synthase/poly-beta-1,6-N-acetylglucosamine synthase-like glycosyltransferase [Ichthyenterobacterium magnum]
MITTLIIIISILYLILIGRFIIGFDKVSHFIIEDIESKTRFSIIIPFRNEAENLPNLLKSISELNYPKHLYEVLFINDKSDDKSHKLVTRFRDSHHNIKLFNNIRLTNSPKKDAITLAINQSQFNWIVTTDADCILPKYWLDSFDYFIQKNDSAFIVAPVTYTGLDSFINRFQLLDFLSLQGATIGGFGIKKPFLCNGANLAYTKQLFETINGFEGNTKIASGDDIFMLEKALKQMPKKVHYLKNKHSVVLTKPQKNLKGLIAQRIRWAAKTSNYNNLFAKAVGLLVLFLNATLICTLILSIVDIVSLKFLMYIWVIKFSVDFLLLFKTARFFNQEHVLASYFFASILYPFFSIYIAFVSVFKGYKWKGRAYNK